MGRKMGMAHVMWVIPLLYNNYIALGGGESGRQRVPPRLIVPANLTGGSHASCAVRVVRYVSLGLGLAVRADDGIRLGETYRNVLQLKTYGSPLICHRGCAEKAGIGTKKGGL